jgi:hypothetical protein
MHDARPVVHAPQIDFGFCLPACIHMALAHFGITATQEELGRALGTVAAIGTPFSRVGGVVAHQITVRLVVSASIADLSSALGRGEAVIPALTTSPGLPGWGNTRTQHTVLVVDIDQEHVSYHDPALPYGPVSTARAEFVLSWEEMDDRAALLSLSETSNR